MLRRARLLQALDHTAHLPLTLVTAPAGYGKTTLLATWAADQRTPVIWVTLDEDDRDPIRLWTHLAAGASRASRGLGSEALARLRGFGPKTEVGAVDSLLTRFAAYGKPLVIVLDDLDAIGGEESARSIEQAVAGLPANVRLIAASRSDPPIGLARLRGRHLLAEVRAGELAFTPAEARDLIVRSEGIALSDESVRVLVQRTEGWPAALYLAALWLRDSPRPDEDARRFGASARQVADYLSEEILAALDDDTRTFLRDTALLDRFTPELCDAILERSDSRAVLTELERSNLFLVSLDNIGEWYRYHRLFQELLLLERPAGDPAAAHRRAADWLREHGFIEEAIFHADAAGDLGLVAEILDESAQELSWSGRRLFLQAWIERLPVELLIEHPSLPAVGAVTAATLGRSSIEVERMASLAERGRRERPSAWDRRADMYLTVARSLAIDGDNVQASLANARAALEIARSAVEELVVPAFAVLARALFFVGDLDAARRAAFEAATRPEAEQRAAGYVGALGFLAAIDAEQGRPEHAAARARQAIDFAREHGLADYWVAAIAHLALADALEQDGLLADAEREASRGEQLWRTEEPNIGHAYALLRLADARVARSRRRQASAALEAAEREIAEFPDPGRLPALAALVETKLAVGPTAASDPAEPPSPGELAVLRYLASDRSQREIAADLYLSYNTVRTHIRAIYRKLNVGSREAAVAKADSLGLLDETRSPG